MSKHRTRMIDKPYIRSVIERLAAKGYDERDKRDLLRIYRLMRRGVGFYLNAADFAEEMHDIVEAVKRKYDANDPIMIQVGHIRERMKKR